MMAAEEPWHREDTSVRMRRVTEVARAAVAAADKDLEEINRLPPSAADLSPRRASSSEQRG